MHPCEDVLTDMGREAIWLSVMSKQHPCMHGYIFSGLIYNIPYACNYAAIADSSFDFFVMFFKMSPP